MSSTVPPLYHMGTAGMMVGDIVRSGEFGQSLMGSGALHPCQPNGHPDYFREYLMEIYRLGANSSAISRLACTFAFESQELAIAGACESGRQAFQVVPVDTTAVIAGSVIGGWLACTFILAIVLVVAHSNK